MNNQVIKVFLYQSNSDRVEQAVPSNGENIDFKMLNVRKCENA